MLLSWGNPRPGPARRNLRSTRHRIAGYGSPAYGDAGVPRRISLADAAGYWAAQFIGGILGALLLWAMFSSPGYSRSATGLGTNGWGAASDIHIGAGGAFLAEVVPTALFVFVVLGVTGKLGSTATAGMVIGQAGLAEAGAAERRPD